MLDSEKELDIGFYLQPSHLGFFQLEFNLSGQIHLDSIHTIRMRAVALEEIYKLLTHTNKDQKFPDYRLQFGAKKYLCQFKMTGLNFHVPHMGISDVLI